MRTRYAAFFLLVLILLQPRTVAGPPDSVVRLGFLAYRGKDNCLAQWKSTADYLSSVITNKKFIVVPLAYNEIIKASESGSIDFVLSNPSLYITLETLHGANRIATLKNRFKTQSTTLMGGVIIRRKDRTDIATITDLKNKRLIATEQLSLGGWHSVCRELLDSGIKPERDLLELRFAYTHDAVIHAVLNGEADAGSVRTGIIEKMEKDGELLMQDICVINEQFIPQDYPFRHSTRLYPEWPMARLRNTSPDLAEDVMCALISMPATHKAALDADIYGWTIPLNYQPVHECLQSIRFMPYKNYGVLTVTDILRAYWPAILGSASALLLMLCILFYSLHLKNELFRSKSQKMINEEQMRTAKACLQTENQYKGLFEYAPIPVWVQDYSSIPEILSSLPRYETIDPKSYLGNHPEIISECQASIRVIDANSATAPMFYKTGEDSFRGCIEKYYSPSSSDVFFRELLCIRDKKTRFQIEADIDASDDVMHRVILNFQVIPGHEDTFKQVLVTVIDITERVKTEAILRARLELAEYANSHSLDDVLRKTIDQVEKLTESKIGFFHFLDHDQETLSLQMWSTNTLDFMCTARGKNNHYSINDAGVWVDCIRQKKTVIHNDYQSLPHRKGLPEGHAQITRELVSPIIRGDLIVAIIGIGNKDSDYSESDIEIASELANMAWDVVMLKRFELEREKLLFDRNETIKQLRCLYESVDIIHTGSSPGFAMSRLVQILPAGSRYPEKTYARINFDDTDYYSGNYSKSSCSILSEITVNNQKRGFIELLYSGDAASDMEKSSGQDLINTIARSCGEIIKRKHAENEIIRYQEKLEELVSDRTSRLEHSLSMLEASLESTVDGLLIAGIDRSITAYNNRFLELWRMHDGAGFTHDNDSFQALIAGQLKDPASYMTKTNHLYASLETEGFDILRLMDGRIIERYSRPQRMADKIIGRVWSYRDVTEQRNAEEELYRAKEYAERANQAKSLFLADMSQEIRTPLNAIREQADLLNKTELTDKQRDYLKKMEDSSRSLLEIANNILDLSKIEAGHIEITSVKFNFEEIIENIISETSVKSQQKGINFVVNSSRAVPPFLIGDPGRLKQILIHLTNNAVKFTEKGRIILSVNVENIQEGIITLAISIQDTGIGISPEEMVRLFQPFSQGDSSATRQYGGTGLGLVITRQLVNIMGGSISVESVPGEGSNFCCHLPFGISE